MCGHKATPQTEILLLLLYGATYQVCSKHRGGQCDECHVIILDTTGTTYTFYKTENKQGNKKRNKKQEDKIKRERRKK